MVDRSTATGRFLYCPMGLSMPISAAEGLEWPWSRGPAGCLKAEVRQKAEGLEECSAISGIYGGGLPLAMLSCNSKA